MGLGGFVIALLLTTLLTFGATATAEELAFKPSGDLQRIKYTGSGQDNVPVIKVLSNGHVKTAHYVLEIFVTPFSVILFSEFPDEETCSEGKSCWHGGDSTKHCFRRWTLIFAPLLTILLYDFL